VHPFVRQRAWLQYTLVSLGITGMVLALYLAKPPFLEILETKSLDLRFLYRGSVLPGDAVALAVIDEKSLDRLGKWPWPRSLFARLIEVLDGMGVRVLALDVGFFEPDRNSGSYAVQAVRSALETHRLLTPETRAILEEQEAMLDEDLQMARAIRNSAMSVVLGYYFHAEAETAAHVDENRRGERNALIRRSAYKLIKYRSPEARHAPLITMHMPEPNVPVLMEAARYAGYFNIFPDKDGVVRWMPLLLQCDGRLYPSLSVQALAAYLGGSPPRLTLSSYGVESLQLGNKVVPTDELGRMLIPYLGPRGTFPYHSIVDILDGSIPREALQDRIVLLGASAVGLYDLRVTPFSSALPGLEIHASVMDRILEERFLVRPEWLSLFDVLLILSVGLGFGLLLSRLQAVGGALCGMAFLGGYVGFAQFMFVRQGVWISLVYPAANLVLVYSAVTVLRYLREERERRKVKHAFDHYLTASVVNEILKHPERLRLGGEKKSLTVMFSDIRGFTSMSESLNPEELVQLLNRYLSLMTDIVFKYEGTLDKYIGDAIMAVWGAPLPQEDHARRACSAALEMVEALALLDPLLKELHIGAFRVGIGVNTGDMVVGNMGSDRRFDYTVMGDSVNLASRLEGANKQYGTSILLNETTHEVVKDAFVCRELDRIRVKGKTRPITIFELLGRRGEASELEPRLRAFGEALELYRQRRFQEALERFETLRKENPEEEPVRLYSERCREYLVRPPDPEWDGVFVMPGK